ncbi:hypothetical protein L202_03542 [Cryptococcus amylolentus CBS 6039]|uniref:Stealth protein CR3 conserved region 3 domain-containing protein n=2 Tax=Cryptococcus amylolentus TaxID=104669 RepID=A0A1E3HTX7_9TREE|nr:hypothetical protein L202_03542 [Cryptococcus amylolentus CBS 6039]ODN79595.1 hypothetical protein L202_03542 [Cryptococcus amylolentus CBS 6039]ODO07921.1 hypothetical protein I350_03502 [Cryptococcus amylolentus CBS 6273]
MSRISTAPSSSSNSPVAGSSRLLPSHEDSHHRSIDPESQREWENNGEDYELEEFDPKEEENSLLPSNLLPFGKSARKRSSDDSSRRVRPYLLSLGAVAVVAGILVTTYFFMGELLPDEPSEEAPNSASVNLSIPIGDFDSENWKENTIALDYDPTHVLIPKHDAPSIPLLEPLHDRLPYPILAEYFVNGKLPSSVDSSNAPPQHPLDLVYLFVNASSPYWFREFEARHEEEGLSSGRNKVARHWRDNGELRAAVRSGVSALGDEAGRIHVVTADWDVRENDTELIDMGVQPGQWRIGQIAEWLNWSSQEKEGRLKWHFHSDVFQLPKDGDWVDLERGASLKEKQEAMEAQNNGEDVVARETWESEAAWREETLPSFNSFSIEQRLAWIEGLSENFVAFNDDMFLLRSLSTSDFRHPLLGNLVRFDPGLLVDLYMTEKQLTDPGEWGALQHANALLAGRFFPRKRFYMHHLPKTQSRALLHEASVMWAPQLSTASSRGFRASRRGEGDVEMAWLITHLRVERWREAVLWSWIVAKVGGVEGVWGEEQKDELRSVLGMAKGEGADKGQVQISRRSRESLNDMDGLMGQAGWEGPKATEYRFSSMDGHMPANPDSPVESCPFTFNVCLPDTFFDSSTTFAATDLFTHIAFQHAECGDCLIDALVSASGKRGLSAIIPDERQIFYPAEEKEEGRWRRSEPMLPLVDKWLEADFTVAANVKAGQDVWEESESRADGGVSLKAWTIKLLSRYNYVYGSTPARFSPVSTVYALTKALEQVDSTPELAMLCVNDDQSDRSSDQARHKFGAWMEKRWGGEIEGVDWERTNVSWVD